MEINTRTKRILIGACSFVGACLLIGLIFLIVRGQISYTYVKNPVQTFDDDFTPTHQALHSSAPVAKINSFKEVPKYLPYGFSLGEPAGRVKCPNAYQRGVYYKSKMIGNVHDCSSPHESEKTKKQILEIVDDYIAANKPR